jgi:hypothetical protein
MKEAIQAWEGEGRAFQLAERPLIGTANQVEWAMQIKTTVSARWTSKKLPNEKSSVKRIEMRSAVPLKKKPGWLTNPDFALER